MEGRRGGKEARVKRETFLAERKREEQKRESEREREVEGETNSLHSLLWSVIRRALVFE